MKNNLIEFGSKIIKEPKENINYDFLLDLVDLCELDLDDFLDFVVKYVEKFSYDIVFLFLTENEIYLDHIDRKNIIKIRYGTIIYPHNEYPKGFDIILFNNINNNLCRFGSNLNGGNLNDSYS